MGNFYEGAEGVEIKTFNGWLTEEEQAEWKRRWLEWIKKNQPLTKEIYDRLPEEAKRKIPHPIVWATNGGIKVRSHGAADQFWDALNDEYSDLAKRRSWKVRLENGWTVQNGKPDPAGGWVYGTGIMVDPQGRSHGPNGQAYGPYAQVEIKPEETRGWWADYLQKEAPAQADPKDRRDKRKQ